MEKSESEIKKEILEYLNTLPGCFAFSVYTGARGKGRSNPQQKGCPDIIGWCYGIGFGIETKKPGQKLSKDQEEFKFKIRRGYGQCMAATSLKDVIHIFDADFRRRCRDALRAFGGFYELF